MENIFVEFLPPWVETGLQPAFYDKESGSVLQQTARMYARVNMLIRMFNKLSKNTKETVEEYINKFNELHDYVQDYFANLDVQEEINNKLDQMAEAGTLADIVAAYIQLRGILAYDTVSDMKIADNLANGSFAETYGFYAKGDGGGAKYKIRTVTNDDVIDEITIIEITGDPGNNLVAELVIENNMTPDQFGAKGDGIHDDSDNIQAYIDNTATGYNIYLNTLKKAYRVTKTIDLKEHGLIGSGFKIGSVANYGIIFDENGTYTNNDAFVNLGKELKDIVIKTENDNLNCIHNSGWFNSIVDSVSISGFGTQLLFDNFVAVVRIVNSQFIGFKDYGVRVIDTNNSESTTFWVDKCVFSYAKGLAIKFDRKLFNASFNNIVFEETNGGIESGSIYRSNFTNIWCEGTEDDQAHDWLVSTTSQQLVGNMYSCLWIKSPWTSKVGTSTASSNNPGGFAIDNNKASLSSSTGQRMCFEPNKISTAFVDGGNSATRSLTITTQDNVGSHKIPIRIKAPNGEMYFDNQDESDTPIAIKTVIGSKNGSNIYATTDITTRNSKQKYVDPITNVNSQYSVSRVYVFNPQHQTVNNGGYSLTKDTDNNEFVLSKIEGYTEDLHNPSIVVSGIIVGSNLGDNSYPVIPAFKLTQPYGSAYSSYSLASSVTIKFYKLDGTVIMPTSFTLKITEEA